MDAKKLTMYAGLGGAVAALGALLPWYAGWGLFYVGGDAMKVLCLLGGLAGVAFFGLDAIGKGGLIKMPGKTKTLIGFIGLCVAGGAPLLRLLQGVGSWGGTALGFWLSLIGGLGGFVAALMLFKAGKTPAASG